MPCSGVEQRNPEILLETAVQDELNNLLKLQVAARTMACEKTLANDAASKHKIVAVKERRSRGSWPPGDSGMPP